MSTNKLRLWAVLVLIAMVGAFTLGCTKNDDKPAKAEDKVEQKDKQDEEKTVESDKKSDTIVFGIADSLPGIFTRCLRQRQPTKR